MKILLNTLIGSRAYGTHNENSDWDYREIVLPPPEYYIGLSSWGQSGTHKLSLFEESMGNIEVVQYEFRKAVNLWLKSNPSALEILAKSQVQVIDPAFQDFFSRRGLFASKRAYGAFLGYTEDQLRRLTSEGPTGQMGAARKELREKFGYDTKYAMHALRLLHTGANYLLTADIGVLPKYVGLYRHIREGLFTLKEFNELVLEGKEMLSSAYIKSSLPEEPDFKLIESLVIKLLKSHINSAI